MGKVKKWIYIIIIYIITRLLIELQNGFMSGLGLSGSLDAGNVALVLGILFLWEKLENER